jgi:hypothetical protein
MWCFKMVKIREKILPLFSFFVKRYHLSPLHTFKFSMTSFYVVRARVYAQVTTFYIGQGELTCLNSRTP